MTDRLIAAAAIAVLILGCATSTGNSPTHPGSPFGGPRTTDRPPGAVYGSPVSLTLNGALGYPANYCLPDACDDSIKFPERGDLAVFPVGPTLTFTVDGVPGATQWSAETSDNDGDQLEIAAGTFDSGSPQTSTAAFDPSALGPGTHYLHVSVKFAGGGFANFGWQWTQ